ncbi:MAG: endonuclease/exonuclease/phosphatase family protein [Bacteroidales bacterium]|nr:endonuclease/exonuclease/phosphatase family protein [Bacteroidales bacterium]MCU0407865.1 endonuclease/exonuclease/phosphatase family protein [Bacteroidales bacterium]
MKKILHRVLLAVNILLALSLVMSYLAAHVNPGVTALPAFFGLAYPYILLLNIFIAIVWLMLLRYEAAISIVVIAAGFTHFSNYIKLGKPGEDKENTFKVLSYNIHLFNYYEKNGGPATEARIMNFIKAQNADIILLQEFYITGNISRKEAELRKMLGSGYRSHLKMIASGKNRYYGIATFTKYPVLRKGEIVHKGSSSLTIYTDLLIGDDTVRVYNNHLQSFRLKRISNSFLQDMTNPDEKESVNEVKDLSLSLRNGFVRRAGQAIRVKEHVNSSPFPVIVAGDFNDTPVSYAYRKLRSGLNDSFVTSGYGAGFTYKGNYPPNRIDYILYDKKIVNSHFDILRVRFSDHYPVVAWFKKKI